MKKKSGKGYRTIFEYSLAPLPPSPVSKENHPQNDFTGLGWDGYQLTALSTLSLGCQDVDFER